MISCPGFSECALPIGITACDADGVATFRIAMSNAGRPRFDARVDGRSVHAPQRHVAVVLHDVHVGDQRVVTHEEAAAAAGGGFDQHHRRHDAIDHLFGRRRQRRRGGWQRRPAPVIGARSGVPAPASLALAAASQARASARASRAVGPARLAPRLPSSPRPICVAVARRGRTEQPVAGSADERARRRRCAISVDDPPLVLRRTAAASDDFEQAARRRSGRSTHCGARAARTTGRPAEPGQVLVRHES